MDKLLAATYRDPWCMPATRHQSRILAMQALCQWDVQKDESHEALADLMLGLCQSLPEGHDSTHFAADLVTGFWRRREEVDERLKRASRRWDLERMSPVERNVMRVAILEMLGGDVPPKVAINEAIEIGKEYGGEDSPRFINGILDEVYRAVQAHSATGETPTEARGSNREARSQKSEGRGSA